MVAIAEPPVVSQDLLNAVNPKKAKSATDSATEASDKFMTLLITQMKNQDPLNPLDNAQVTSQLAQLSTVTGVNKLNDTLESLKASYQSSEQMAATNLIGHGVLVEGNYAHLEGHGVLVEGNYAHLENGKAIFGVELDTPADSVQVEVWSNRTGRVVETIDMGPQKAGIVPVAWDNVVDETRLDKDGKPITLPDGEYSIRLTALRGGEKLTDARPLAFDSVMSVTTSAKDGVKINLPNKGAVTMADIKQIL
jgi:flagellar basal-body rod modification protein FlgD